MLGQPGVAGDLHADGYGGLYDGDGDSAISVNRATPTITWSPPAAITYGTALSATQLNATGSVAGTLAYSPVAGAVLTRVPARHCR